MSLKNPRTSQKELLPPLQSIRAGNFVRHDLNYSCQDVERPDCSQVKLDLRRKYKSNQISTVSSVFFTSLLPLQKASCKYVYEDSHKGWLEPLGSSSIRKASFFVSWFQGTWPFAIFQIYLLFFRFTVFFQGIHIGVNKCIQLSVFLTRLSLFFLFLCFFCFSQRSKFTGSHSGLKNTV